MSGTVERVVEHALATCDHDMLRAIVQSYSPQVDARTAEVIAEDFGISEVRATSIAGLSGEVIAELRRRLTS